MSSGHPRGFRFHAVVVLILTAGVARMGFAQTTWYFYYEQGLQQLERHNYQGAIRSFEEALRLRPKPSARARTRGMFFREYFPYFQLARAYLGLGDVQTAADMLARELVAGEIQKNKKFFAQAQELQAQIEARLRPAPPVPEPAPEPTAPEQPKSEEQPETTPTTEPEPTPPPPPPMPRAILFEAWRLYTQSDYERMIALLEQNLNQPYRGNDTVYFLLSCAYAARYFLSGEANSTYLQKARDYARRIQRVPPPIQRRLNVLVSPKIRRLLRLPQGE